MAGNFETDILVLELEHKLNITFTLVLVDLNKLVPLQSQDLDPHVDKYMDIIQTMHQVAANRAEQICVNKQLINTKGVRQQKQ